MRQAFSGIVDGGLFRDRPAIWNAGVVLLSVLLLIVAGDKMAASPAYALSVFVMLGAVILMVIDFRLALLLFVGFLFAYEEFNLTSQEAFVEKNIENTVIAVKLFGFALMDLVSVVLLVPVVLREWRRAVETGRWRWFRTDLFLLPLLAVWIYGMIPGIAHMQSFSDFTWDLRMLAHVAVFYFIFSRAFETRRDILLALLVGGGVFLAKHAMFLFRFVTGGGIETGVYRRVMLGSDLPLTAFALGLTVAALLIFRRRKEDGAFGADAGDHRIAEHPAAGRQSDAASGTPAARMASPIGMSSALRTTLLLLTVYFIVMLIAGLGKLTYLQALYSLVMIWILHRRDIRPRAVLGVAVTGLAVGTLVVMTLVPPAIRDTLLYALTHAFNWWDALKLYGDLSFGTRLLEIVNIWDQLVRHGAVFFGQGWGAAWRELTVHMPFDGGAFAVEEQYSGVHVQAHIDAITFMLKVGIVGTLIIYGVFFRYWLTGIRLYRTRMPGWQRWTLMGLLLLIVIIAPNYLYFIRLKYLLGFALAGITVFAATHEHDTTNHTGIADPHYAE